MVSDHKQTNLRNNDINETFNRFINRNILIPFSILTFGVNDSVLRSLCEKFTDLYCTVFEKIL